MKKIIKITLTVVLLFSHTFACAKDLRKELESAYNRARNNISKNTPEDFLKSIYITSSEEADIKGLIQNWNNQETKNVLINLAFRDLKTTNFLEVRQNKDIASYYYRTDDPQNTEIEVYMIKFKSISGTWKPQNEIYSIGVSREGGETEIQTKIKKALLEDKNFQL